MLPLEKKKNNNNNDKKKKKIVIKEPDAKCIYLFIHSVPPPIPLCRERRSIRGGSKKGGGGQRSWWWRRLFNRQVTHKHKHTRMRSLTWHSSFSSLHTRSHAASTLRSCRCVSRPHPPVQVQRQSQKNRRTRRGKKNFLKKKRKKGGSPRLSGMTKIKAFKKEGLKEEKNNKRHATTLFPNLHFTAVNGDESVSKRRSTKS